MQQILEHPLLNIDFSIADPGYYEEKRAELRSAYLESHELTQEVLDRLIDPSRPNNDKIGDKYTTNPSFPDNPLKAFELYKNFHAYQYFLTLVQYFLERNLGKWNTRSIKIELERQNKFIQSTEKIEPSKVFENRFYTTDEDEYVKLRDGYYEVHLVNDLDRYAVYGNYFQFNKLLEFKFAQFNKNFSDLAPTDYYARISQLFKPTSNIERREELDKLYKGTDNKTHLLDYLKYEFIPDRKRRHKMHEDTFGGGFRIPRVYGEKAIECIEQWLTEMESLRLKPKTVNSTNGASKIEKEIPQVFEELFYNTDLAEPCIDILKELDPPLIDTDCNFIGKPKGTVVVWIEELQRQGIIKYYSDRKIYASLVKERIHRFTIDESMFGKPQKRAEERYRADIRTRVSQIKLSQNSQKGK